jgi:hypothetical protein
MRQLADMCHLFVHVISPRDVDLAEILINGIDPAGENRLALIQAC